MSMVRFRNTLLLLALLFTSTLYAQETMILSGFNGKAADKSVLLQWTIRQGQTCLGTIIERSPDTLHFEPIGEIPGICGSSGSPVPYLFNDESPLVNQVNYYRLELGGQGYSRILAIPYFAEGNSGSLVIPNPANQETRIHFENKEERPFQLTLTDMQGKTVLQQQGSTGMAALELGHLPSGTYFYRVSIKDKPLITGKLLISH